jgi:hypothetical protein
MYSQFVNDFAGFVNETRRYSVERPQAFRVDIIGRLDLHGELCNIV